MRKEKVCFKNSKGQRLCGYLYIPDGKGPFPAVILIHGFTGGTHEVKNRFMCDKLADEGFVAFMFDFYDKPNGLSEPKIENTNVTQQVKDTGAAIDFIETFDFVDKNRIGLTGHSLGGMTVVLYAATQDPRIKALVVQSAAADIDKTVVAELFDEEAKKRGYALLDKSWGNVKINYSFYEDVKKYDVYKEAEKIICPTLIFHGDKDEVVPYQQSVELFKHIKVQNKKLEIIKGADHCFYNKPTLSITTNLMIDWFKKYLK